MIDKIERIHNIGNFDNYDAAGNVALGKMSFVYAINGAGKTTLARILQSLSIGDGSIIARHKRIGAAGDPAVILTSAPNRYKFRNGAWDATIPEVAVFDSHFVANNVYSGFVINSDHHKSLYQFVVGDSGVEIMKKIERVKDLISACNDEKNRLGQLITATAQYDDYEKICGLARKPDVDNLIAEKDKELTLAKSQEQLAQQKLPAEITVAAPAISTANAQHVLETTVEGIGEAYVEEVKAHLDKMFRAGMQKCSDWVYQGTTLTGRAELKDEGQDTCPFCGQKIGGVELVKGYNQYFSNAYRSALKNARDLLTQIEQINIESYLLRLKGQYEQIETAHKFWKTVMPEQPDVPAFDVDAFCLEEKYKALKASIVCKAENPVAAVSLDALMDYKKALEDIAILCGQVNTYVKEYVAKINELRSKIRPVADVEKELKELKIYKARYEQPLMDYCMQYDIAVHQADRLQKINKELQRQQKAASNLLFSQYGAKINDYLRNVFKTPFQISDVKDGGFRGASRRPNLDYTLTFNGTPISQDEGMQNTSFKNVLSEGDKNTIAFSFFLAKLTSDPHYADKIVVFDDPLTSLDMNRRTATIEQLVKLYGDCKQVIVLSHNLHFLIDLNTRKRISRTDKVSLQIVNRNGSSSIEQYEIKSEWIDRYKKAIIAMTEFVANPDPAKQDEAVNAIRISLETFLKLKFCQYIPDFNLTFGKLIDRLKQMPCTFVNPDKNSVITKLMDLDEMSWKTHHGTVDEMDVYHEVDLTPAEAQNYVQDTLNLLEKEL